MYKIPQWNLVKLIGTKTNFKRNRCTISLYFLFFGDSLAMLPRLTSHSGDPPASASWSNQGYRHEHLSPHIFKAWFIACLHVCFPTQLLSSLSLEPHFGLCSAGKLLLINPIIAWLLLSSLVSCSLYFSKGALQLVSRVKCAFPLNCKPVGHRVLLFIPSLYPCSVL